MKLNYLSRPKQAQRKDTPVDHHRAATEAAQARAEPLPALECILCRGHGGRGPTVHWGCWQAAELARGRRAAKAAQAPTRNDEQTRAETVTDLLDDDRRDRQVP